MTQTLQAQGDPKAEGSSSGSYFSGLYTIAAGVAYKKAIVDIQNAAQILSNATIVAVTLANSSLMTLLNEFIEQKNKKLQYWTDKISALEKNGKISKDDAPTLNDYQIHYNEVSTLYDAPTQTLQATSSSFTNLTQTLATDFKNFIDVLGALVGLQTYVAQKAV